MLSGVKTVVALALVQTEQPNQALALVQTEQPNQALALVQTEQPNQLIRPKTGDNSNLALWFALLFVSGGAAIGTTVVSRKKKYNR